ncbi:MAG TPA: GNAT family N-acetyltransferase [Mycobacterium sp.]|uniref:GNAT family N-acetyltransferase n=1 Tax=Mycobacterium sp. TaxID=1785 RepID=UPI002D394F83|nr:GNAT family N-acetyltransferase [Mycobacterium sp.]HZU49380.1 GNAT family N-acetyltransferase [Mycobacterium sp.]
MSFLRKRRQSGRGVTGGPLGDPVITNAAELKHRRYAISVGGVEVGLTAYVDTDGQRIFYHTKVSDELRSGALADTLIMTALDDTRTTGKRIVALCPRVAAYVDREESYDDLLDPVTPRAHAAVRAELAGDALPGIGPE